jgi:hypothetical protein
MICRHTVLGDARGTPVHLAGDGVRAHGHVTSVGYHHYENLMDWVRQRPLLRASLDGAAPGPWDPTSGGKTWLVAMAVGSRS